MRSPLVINPNISYKSPGQFEETRFEKIHNEIFQNSIDASIAIANEIAELIRSKQELNMTCVLGLVTGTSPIKIYEELVRLHKEEGLSFYNVISFNLDEFFPLSKEDKKSNFYYMRHHLFDHVDINPENINIPDGDIDFDDISQYCIDYEMKIKNSGGLDFQLLGIGCTGYIGLNESGSQNLSGTRIVSLDDITRAEISFGFNSVVEVPKRAITMGIATILRSKRIVLMAWGEKKAKIIRRTIQGQISTEVPATFLQKHGNVTFVLDSCAAAELTKINTPWLLGECLWTPELKTKAIVWICQQTNKCILKLRDKDYIDYGMSDLIVLSKSSYDLNTNVFKELQNTITDWPGGNLNYQNRNDSLSEYSNQKKILIFSPSPEDAVISMGGTLIKLINQNYQVHIVYLTSGDISVSDEEALKYVEVCCDFINQDTATIINFQSIIDILNQNKYDETDSKKVVKLKGLIKKRESYASVRSMGLKDENIHFMDLTFGETVQIDKQSLLEENVNKVITIIEKIKPHQIFASGHLTEAHSNYGNCLNLLRGALKSIGNKAFVNNCSFWLYCAGPHVWNISETHMAVPLSSNEILQKKHAISYYQSQKSIAVFQENDSKNFWLNTDERTQINAKLYNDLGLAEYEAIETFKRLTID